MTKEELLSYNNIKKELEDINKQINGLRERGRIPKAVSYTKMPSSGIESLSPQQLYIEQLEELLEIYEKKKCDLIKAQIAIEKALSALPHELSRMMRYRYIERYEWVKINNLMSISESTSMRWHREALKQISSL